MKFTLVIAALFATAAIAAPCGKRHDDNYPPAENKVPSDAPVTQTNTQTAGIDKSKTQTNNASGGLLGAVSYI